MTEALSAAALREDAWYLVYTKPKEEFRAVEQLTNQGYVCFLPTIFVEKLQRGRLVDREEPLFNRYLFVRLNMQNGVHTVQNTRGVSHLVTLGGKFARAPDSFVDTLQYGPKRLSTPFDKGDRVVVKAGPFAGVEGIFQNSSGEARALLLIELMSKPHELDFPVGMLQKVA
jgi:transcriptional antiterminator RfaH